jgi:hypothetical protein
MNKKTQWPNINVTKTIRTQVSQHYPSILIK